ncbi:MAG: NAD-dependent succinate-semialdehyde dehydrogenase [Deltaproteobacteria bacterium]|nr:NAD-dependent succinate-semialdehyde dehydrogenase [Deltaproteobacteria bacterium]
MIFKSINPVSEKVLAKFASHSKDAVMSALQKSQKAQRLWTEYSIEERAECIKKIAEILRARRQEFSEVITHEMGKPIAQSLAEIDKCADLCEYYSKNAKEFLKNEIIVTNARRSLVQFGPLGGILGIMPWNFPFWQVFRFAIPSLMAGNSIFLKHAPNVFGCAEKISFVFNHAKLPHGIFQNLRVDVKSLENIVAHPFIRGVSLTGSTRAGRSIAALAGKYLKKTVLELGGSDAYLILEDADLERAATACATSRLLNSGQSCIAAKRFIVIKPIATDFTDLLIEKMKSFKMGNPLLLETQVGPLARSDLRENLVKQMKKSIQKGAQLSLGGQISKGTGFYFPPSVLVKVHPGMPAFDEETFGPLAAIITAKNEAEAFELANRTSFGLGSAIFSKDVDRALNLSKKMEAGNCFINGFVRSDARMPFGGMKDSGYGRELGSFGIHEFSNIQSVWVE